VLVFYLLGLGLVMGVVLYIYSISLDKRGNGRTKSRKGELAGNMWAATSLDCDFEPTKHAFGPGRSVNAASRFSVLLPKNE